MFPLRKMTEKPLMMMDAAAMAQLHTSSSSGLNFHIVESAEGLMIVLQSGEAMPLYNHADCFCLADHLAGSALPRIKSMPYAMQMIKNHSGRHQAMDALNRANISSSFMGGAGASPLIGSSILEKDTLFYRFISSETDFRYNDGVLSAETYVTTANEAVHVNTGFSVVARFALPLALPASVRIEYRIPKGTKIQVGTVAPNFGQAGGGVEIFLPAKTPAKKIKLSRIPDF